MFPTFKSQAIISAVTDASDRTHELLQDLSSFRVTFRLVTGIWKGKTERSILIQSEDIESVQTACKLALSKYQQEAVIVKTIGLPWCLVHQDGEVQRMSRAEYQHHNSLNEAIKGFNRTGCNGGTYDEQTGLALVIK